jgi:anaerobic carbon-monoxide dehydrogenase catalytic subunit
MEFIQKKTADASIEHFLSKAAESEISLVWDRYEGQLPECGFCETGLSCRDCLQGPCISHPFRDSDKTGICGKERDVLAIQSLLRLVLKGTITYLDRVSDLAKGIESKEIKPKNKTKTDQWLKEVQSLFQGDGTGFKKEFPRPFIRRWEEMGISPEGITRDLFKAFQKFEGGITDAEETLLWSFKSSLLGCIAHWLYGRLKRSAFGEPAPTRIEVNLGVLKKESPNLLMCGHFSPVLKRKIAEAAKKNGVHVSVVCSDPLLPPFHFPVATNYGSQEIPCMTGAVDLIVVGDQWVNPSLMRVAKEFEVSILSTEGLKRERNPGRFAREIVDQTKKSFDFRRHIPRDVPEGTEVAMMGFSGGSIHAKKILGAVQKGQIRGIVVFCGSNNVKYTQDQEITILAQEFLKNDILCIAKGEASVALAKYGFLNPLSREKYCGKDLSAVLSSLEEETPSVLDLGGGEDGAVIDLFLEMVKIGKKDLKELPIVACYPEANRSSEVTEAMWTVAMGVPTYFWPALPVTGSPKTIEGLSKFSEEKFGAKLHILTEKKIDARAKAKLILEAITGKEGYGFSGKPWI